MNFVEFVNAYSKKKLREQGTRKVSRREVLKLREAYKKLFGKKRIHESVKVKRFKSFLMKFSEHKRKVVGTAKITESELNKLKVAFRKLREGDFGGDMDEAIDMVRQSAGSGDYAEFDIIGDLEELWRQQSSEPNSDDVDDLYHDILYKIEEEGGDPEEAESALNEFLSRASGESMMESKRSRKRRVREADFEEDFDDDFDLDMDDEMSESFPDGLEVDEDVELFENKNSFLSILKQYREFKRRQTGSNKVTMREMKNLKREYRKLREADAAQADPMAADPQAAGADPNAAADPALAGAAATVDPTVTAQIQDVLDSVNALAASAGVQTTDLGADPNAGVAPVDGMGADPGAAGAEDPQAAGLAESLRKFRVWKIKNRKGNKVTLQEAILVYKKMMREKASKPKSRYQQIKERIAARQRALKGLQENGATDWVEEKMKLVPELTSGTTGDRGAPGDDELVKIPNPKEVANGTTSGKGSGETKPAKTWPTKAMGKEAGGALQGEGAKMKEAVSDVTKAYVDNYLHGEKLDFKKLNEALNKGLLG